MELSEFDFDLPPELIAQHPPEQRDAARMLVMDRKSGATDDRHFRDFPELLRGDELVVLNNTRVLPARLFGRREGVRSQKPGENNPARDEHLKSSIEVLLVRQIEPDLWETLVRPGRKIPVGERIIFGDGELEARVEDRGGYGLRLLRFTSRGSFAEAIAQAGPYSAAALYQACRRAGSTASGIRRFTRGRGARWPRQLQAFISRPKFLN